MQHVLDVLAAWSLAAVCLTAQADTSRDDAGLAPVDHVYHVTTFAELDVVESNGPEPVPHAERDVLSTAATETSWRNTRRDAFTIVPRVVIDGAGEAVAALGDRARSSRPPAIPGGRVALRLSEARDVTGRLFVPTTDASAQVALSFRVPASAFTAEARDEWLQVVADEAATWIDAGAAGTAWYRSRLDAARRALGEDAAALDVAEASSAASDLEESFRIFSGGRALAENLALDRLLEFGDDADAVVPIDEIDGVAVRPYEWGELVDGLEPEVDPLAAAIPHDQHAVFFPSVGALVDVVARLDELSASIGRFGEQRSQNASTRARYERQLGLALDVIARQFAGEVVGGVAVTGGDPYFRTGTDVAVLFEATAGAASRLAVQGFVAARATSGGDDVAASTGEVGGLSYRAWRSPDRAVSAYVAAFDDVIVVTNSPAQLERLAATRRGDVASLDDLDEYTFFRDRYRRGGDESALVVLSDATIRRWCGPRVRIGSSRRARAAAVMSEVTARAIDDRLDVEGASFATPDDLPDAGTLTLRDGAVLSSDYGSLAFATPISELDLDRVTEEEEALYSRWRRGYETNWRVFDPIASRLVVSGDEIALDTTVRPLIIRSEYEDLIRITSGGSIEPYGGDLHDRAIMHFALALDVERLALQPESGMVNMMVPGVDVFSWLGDSLSVYVEDDPRWGDWLEVSSTAELDDDVFDVPVGLQVDVGNALRLAGFLTALRGTIDTAAPDTTEWTSLEHEGRSYVRIGSAQGDTDEAVYYVVLPGSLTVSPNEGVIRRAIERGARRATAKEAGEPTGDEAFGPWRGEHVAWRADVASASAYYDAMTSGVLVERLRAASWRNIPILNVWRRQFPDADPLEVHERRFARRLLDPTGARYVWDDDWGTYRSTHWGHPGAPRTGPRVPPWLDALDAVSAGLTFEDDGLRAKLVVELGDDAR